MKSAPTTPADTVDGYLANVPADDRVALEKLRTQIRAEAPGATERIAYAIPTYTLDGPLVGFGAFKNHLTFFVMSTAAIDAHAADLAGRSCTKGGVHFTADKPLPAALVKKLVKARIAENKSTVAARAARKSAKAAAAKKAAKPSSTNAATKKN